MIIAIIAIGLVMIMVTAHNQDSVVNGRPRGGYRLGNSSEVSVFEVGSAFKSILEKYVFTPTIEQFGEITKYKNPKNIILLNNGEIIDDCFRYVGYDKIEMKLFTGGRNTYNDATLIIYPNIEDRVGIQIKAFRDKDTISLWQECSSLAFWENDMTNWLKDYENDYNLEQEFKKYPVFQYVNK